MNGLVEQHGIENALHAIPIRLKFGKSVGVAGRRFSFNDAIAKDRIELRIIQSCYGLPVNAEPL